MRSPRAGRLSSTDVRRGCPPPPVEGAGDAEVEHDSRPILGELGRGGDRPLGDLRRLHPRLRHPHRHDDQHHRHGPPPRRLRALAGAHAHRVAKLGDSGLGGVAALQRRGLRRGAAAGGRQRGDRRRAGDLLRQPRDHVRA